MGKDRLFFTYSSKPVSKHVLEACNKVKLQTCRCGGDPQFIVMAHDKLDCEVKCTSCGQRSAIYPNPEQAASAWKVAMNKCETTCSLHIGVKQPTSLKLLSKIASQLEGIETQSCGCGGSVSLFIADPTNEYSYVSCDNCGHETDLQETAKKALDSWNLR